MKMLTMIGLRIDPWCISVNSLIADGNSTLCFRFEK